MTDERIKYIEKIKLKEWEGFGWGVKDGPIEVVRELLAEIRELREQVPTLAPIAENFDLDSGGDSA